MDFHPYGDFLSSGSHDTNLKLWDIRRKGCIFTYTPSEGDKSCARARESTDLVSEFLSRKQHLDNFVPHEFSFLAR